MGIDEMGNYVVEYHTEKGPFLIAVHHPKTGMRLWSRDVYQQYGAAMEAAKYLETVYGGNGLLFYIVTQAATRAASYKVLSGARKRKLKGIVRVVEGDAESGTHSTDATAANNHTAK